MAAAAYAVVLLALFVFQSRLVYFPNMPSRAIGPGPDSIGLAYEPVEIITEDGIKLDAWYVPAQQPRGVMLFFHGNAGNISHRLDSLRIFNTLNLDTLIFDYRGYGRSEGKVSEQGTYRDGEAVWRFLTEKRGIAAAEIVIFGRSLGAAIAAYVASRHRPGALILTEKARARFGSAVELIEGDAYDGADVQRLVEGACAARPIMMPAAPV